jgi:predicted peptidase
MGGLAAGKQTKRPINTPYAKNGFLEYLPKGYGDGTKWPLLVFWAGVGENGNGSSADLDKGFHHGPPKLIAANQWPSDRPFIVLTPQHNGQLPFDRPTADETHDFLAFALTNYDVDPARMYLTALSSGAKGSWDYLVAYKGTQLAAAVLIAGDASEPYGKAGCSIVNAVPVWDFHGTADTEQKYEFDSGGMAQFQSCPQPRKEVKFTSYPGASHADSWTKTYDLSAGNDIYAWLLTKVH